MSTKFFTDVMTPRNMIVECVKGLPKDVMLIDIKFDNTTNTIICLFDDGKSGTKRIPIIFTHPECKFVFKDDK